MSISTRAILRAATRSKEDSLNILSLPLNGIFEHFMADTGHNMYLSPIGSSFNINTQDRLNIKFIKSHQDTIDIPQDIDFDLIVCNSINQIATAEQISDLLHIPVMVVHHFYPNDPELAQDTIKSFRLDRFHNVFVHKTLKEIWGIDGEVLPYYLPNTPPAISQSHITIAGHLDKSHVAVIEQFKKKFGKVHVINMDSNICLDNIYQLLSQTKCLININTTLCASWPALFAVQMGITVISPENPTNNLFIKDQGYITNSLPKMLELAEASSSGKQNLETSTVSDWDELLRRTADKVYIGY